MTHPHAPLEVPPVFPRRSRAARTRLVVILVLVAVAVAGSLWWGLRRNAALPAGNAGSVLLTQSTRWCGDAQQPARAPVWLDAARVAVALGRPGSSTLVAIGPDGGHQPLVPSATIDQWQFKAFLPAPGCEQPAIRGKLLAFVRNGDIWLQREAAVAVQLTRDGQAGQPAFAPDAARLYYVSRASGRFALWSTALDGEQPELVLGDDHADYAAPAVSPDGNWLAFVSNRSGTPDLWAMRLADGELFPLTAAAAVETAPAWSPDGTMLAYCAGDDRNSDLWVVNADGSSPTRLTATATCEYAPAWSPDGTRLAAQVGANAGATVWCYTLGFAGYNTPVAR
ncbi:MAG TPA: hypothetical protein PKM88_02355 [bacterium]|nr:hypothetical protein [bacterium]